jgi:hypothetical protein
LQNLKFVSCTIAFQNFHQLFGAAFYARQRVMVGSKFTPPSGWNPKSSQNAMAVIYTLFF